MTTAEKGKKYYDDLFRKSETYQLDFKDSPYKGLWKLTVDKIIKESEDNKIFRVIEFGCGTGQMAEYLYSRTDGELSYIGFDISKVAIRKAEERTPEMLFRVGSAYDKDLYVKGAMYVFNETFEHIDDIKVIGYIPDGSIVIFSVPSFDDESHLRTFPFSGSVVERYGNLFKSLEVHEYYDNKGSRYYICKAIK